MIVPEWAQELLDHEARSRAGKCEGCNAERCQWEGHQAAIDEAGWCPVCDQGSLDPEWAARNEVEM